MIVKTVILCNVSICRNLCLKLQNIDKGDVARHKRALSTIGSYKACPFIGFHGNFHEFIQ